MANGIKIATIGGGSSYTPELVEGFIRRYENLPVDELWLVDIPEGQEKLDTVGAPVSYTHLDVYKRQVDTC